MKVKTFIHAIRTVSINSAKAKTFLQDKRLSQSEKIILNCFLHYRDNDLEQIITDLKSITEYNDAVVESQKELLLGLTMTGKGFFPEALKHMERSFSLLQDQGLPYFEYLITYNQFIISFNMKNQKLMKKFLDKLKQLSLEKDTDCLLVMRCFLNYHLFTNNLEKARQVIDEIDVMFPLDKMVDPDAPSYLIDKMNFSIKSENFDESMEILEKMKNYRKFRLTENFQFIKLLVENITNDSPIYFSDTHFKRVPVLFHQMKVIRALEEGKQGEANDHWKKLSLLSPEIYQPNFLFKGDKCLFSIALMKQLEKLKIAEAPVIISDNSSQHEKIITILKQAKVPVGRDFLFKSVYGKEAETKEDYLRLSKVIYRLKIKLEIEIHYKKGCYFLEKVQTAA